MPRALLRGLQTAEGAQGGAGKPARSALRAAALYVRGRDVDKVICSRNLLAGAHACACIFGAGPAAATRGPLSAPSASGAFLLKHTRMHVTLNPDSI